MIIMNIFLVFIQLYFYLFWTITNWCMKMFFPIQSTIEQIFPTKLKVNIQNIFIIDLMYQKKIICNKNIKLKHNNNIPLKKEDLKDVRLLILKKLLKIIKWECLMIW